MARPSKALLVFGDLLGLEDVELDDPLRGLELAHLHGLARLLHVTQVVGQRDFL
jgi:hypothetical protein